MGHFESNAQTKCETCQVRNLVKLQSSCSNTTENILVASKPHQPSVWLDYDELQWITVMILSFYTSRYFDKIKNCMTETHQLTPIHSSLRHWLCHIACGHYVRISLCTSRCVIEEGVLFSKGWSSICDEAYTKRHHLTIPQIDDSGFNTLYWVCSVRPATGNKVGRQNNSGLTHWRAQQKKKEQNRHTIWRNNENQQTLQNTHSTKTCATHQITAFADQEVETVQGPKYNFRESFTIWWHL